MGFTVSDLGQAHKAAAGADQGMPRRPLWPVLVIAFGISATLLWAGVLLWLLSRMIFLLLVS